MKKEYLLITKKNIVIPVIIQEEAKEDFKKLMGWSENKFKKNTCRKFSKVSHKHERRIK